MPKQTFFDIPSYILSRTDQELSTLTVHDIANMCGDQTKTVLQQFEQRQQISFEDYLSRERVYRAATKLRKHEVTSLKNLSNALGFLDSEDFSTEFKRFFFVDPERYFYLMEVKRFKQNFQNSQ